MPRVKLNPIDIELGRRLRELRDLQKIPQTKLAEALKISFQQIQKYEKGTNRIAASTLLQIAAFYKVPVGYFVDGIVDHRNPYTIYMPKEEKLLLEHFRSISSDYHKEILVELSKVVSSKQTH